MTYLLMRQLFTISQRYITLSGSLLSLAAMLFLLDHRFTEMTWGALALAAGVLLTRAR